MQTQHLAQFIEQLTSQSKVIYQLRNENRALRDSEAQYKLRISDLERELASSRLENTSNEEKIEYNQVPLVTTNKQQVRRGEPKEIEQPLKEETDTLDDEMRSLQLAEQLFREEENQFQQKLYMMQGNVNTDEMDYEQLTQLQDQMGFVSRGFPSSQIQQLVEKYKTQPHHDQDCTICFNNNITIVLPCKHTFHCECLESWFAQEKNCPLCKIEVRL